MKKVRKRMGEDKYIRKRKEGSKNNEVDDTRKENKIETTKGQQNRNQP
jgi:hypothetical protein